VNFAKKLGMPVIGIIENMSGFKCPKCGEVIDLFKTGGGERAATDMGVPFLGRIPIEVNIVLSGDSGIPFVLAHESEAASAFEAIVDNIEHIVKGDRASVVCINKYDINYANSERITEFCRERGVAIVRNIPYDPVVTEAMVAAMPVVEFSDGEVSDAIKEIWASIK
jgi:MinD superfamily P-loop ATPase